MSLNSFEDGVVDFKSMYSFFKDLASRYNCIITHASVLGLGYPSGIKKLKQIDSLLLKNEFANIKSIEVFSIVSEGKFSYAWQFYGSIECTGKYKGYDLVVCMDEKYRIKQKQIIADIVRDISNINYFDYGVVYTREYVLGPHYYAAGIIEGLERGSEESEQISKWFRARINNTLSNRCLLRSVYEYNILSSKHLSLPVSRKTLFGKTTEALKDWIINDKMGNVDVINTSLSIWDIKEKRHDAFNVLCSSGLLVYCL